MRSRRGLIAVAALVGLIGLASCRSEKSDQVAVSERSDRFGIFRDLVLLDRSAAAGGPFFIDRFESTVADWYTYEHGTAAGPSEDEKSDSERFSDLRPIAGVELSEARGFARWRFCRLPRRSEWYYAATRLSLHPWGMVWRDAFANTNSLRRGEVAPVGTFESGRSPDGAYDLIGNVAEWTETVFIPRRSIRAGPRIPVLPTEQPLGVRYALPGWVPLPLEWMHMATYDGLKVDTVEVEEWPGLEGTPPAGLACWLPDWAPVPYEWMVMKPSFDLSRVVLGGSFETRLGQAIRGQNPQFPQEVRWFPGRSGPVTGIRLVAAPADLLRSLIETRPRVDAAARATLLRFLRQPDHRRVLLVAWRWLVARGWVQREGDSKIRKLLEAEFGK